MLEFLVNLLLTRFSSISEVLNLKYFFFNNQIALQRLIALNYTYSKQIFGCISKDNSDNINNKSLFA